MEHNLARIKGEEKTKKRPLSSLHSAFLFPFCKASFPGCADKEKLRFGSSEAKSKSNSLVGILPVRKAILAGQIGARRRECWRLVME